MVVLTRTKTRTKTKKTMIIIPSLGTESLSDINNLPEEARIEFNRLQNHYCCCVGYDYETGGFMMDRYVAIFECITGIPFQEESNEKIMDPSKISKIYRGLRELLDRTSSPEWTTHYQRQYEGRTTNYLIHLSNHYSLLKEKEKETIDTSISIGELVFLCGLFFLYQKYGLSLVRSFSRV